jgi:hypothetical protein
LCTFTILSTSYPLIFAQFVYFVYTSHTPFISPFPTFTAIIYDNFPCSTHCTSKTNSDEMHLIQLMLALIAIIH